MARKKPPPRRLVEVFAAEQAAGIPTSECPYCNQTGIGPGDGRTECGFCTITPDEVTG